MPRSYRLIKDVLQTEDCNPSRQRNKAGSAMTAREHKDQQSKKRAGQRRLRHFAEGIYAEYGKRSGLNNSCHGREEVPDCAAHIVGHPRTPKYSFVQEIVSRFREPDIVAT